MVPSIEFFAQLERMRGVAFWAIAKRLIPYFFPGLPRQVFLRGGKRTTGVKGKYVFRIFGFSLLLLSLAFIRVFFKRFEFKVGLDVLIRPI